MLYAARDLDTVIAEVRPWVGAPVSVATLKTLRRLKLVDFSPRRRSPPGASGGAEAGHASETPDFSDATIRTASGASAQRRAAVTAEEVDEIISSIGAAMARPVNPDESEVRYVPTQYVAELVQAEGYDGVMFRSAVGPGTNVVLFDKEDARVEHVDLYEVRSVRYKFAPHPSPPPRANFADDDDDRLDFF